MDPIVEVQELAFGFRFRVANSELSEIVRKLNAKLGKECMITGREYIEIINEKLDDPYKLPCGQVSDIVGFIATGHETFLARVIWASDPIWGQKAIGELTNRGVEAFY